MLALHPPSPPPRPLPASPCLAPPPPPYPFASLSLELVHHIAEFLPCIALARLARTCRRFSKFVPPQLLLESFVSDFLGAPAFSQTSRFLSLFEEGTSIPHATLQLLSDRLMPSLRFGIDLNQFPAMSDLYAFPDILNQVLNSVQTEATDWKPFYIKAFERQRADIVRMLISTKRTIAPEDVVLFDLMAQAVRIGRSLDVIQAFAEAPGASLDNNVDVCTRLWMGSSRHISIKGPLAELALDTLGTRPYDSPSSKESSCPLEVLEFFLIPREDHAIDFTANGGRMLVKAVAWATPAHVQALLDAGADLDLVTVIDVCKLALDLHGVDSEMYKLVRSCTHPTAARQKRLRMMEILNRTRVDVDGRDAASVATELRQWILDGDVDPRESVQFWSPVETILRDFPLLESLAAYVARSASIFAPGILRAFAEVDDTSNQPPNVYESFNEAILFESIISGSPDTVHAVLDMLSPEHLAHSWCKITWKQNGAPQSSDRSLGLLTRECTKSLESCNYVSLLDRGGFLAGYTRQTDVMAALIDAGADTRFVAGGQFVGLCHECRGRGVGLARAHEALVLDIVANRDPNIFWLPGRRCDPETIVNYYASDALSHGWIGVFDIQRSRYPQMDMNVVRPVYVCLLDQNMEGVRHLVLTGAVEDDLVTSGFHERLPQDHPVVVRAIRKPDMTPQQWLDVLEPCFELVLEGLRSEDADTDEFGVIFPEKYL
ncbi:hypothetical protein HDU89_000471 [Geranomyces variabilis]|nr:hypothetical protein HDU89_000471 [Geranomyces variabilis]